MTDLFGDAYASIYEALNEVREVFHREGRISDSNAKLDETVKLLSLHFAAHTGRLSAAKYQALVDKKTFSVERLNRAFIEIASRAPFLTAEGQSIFGVRPETAFEAKDENVAFELFRAAGHALRAQANENVSLDVLNEAFGHHVRDNFRGHIEDAQYMTPPEVIDFMVSLAAEEVLGAGPWLVDHDFTMMDPSCGVGSFITAWRKEYERRRLGVPTIPPLLAIGQDKVERMARLSAMNLIFAQNKTDRILVGNSLMDGSALDKFNGCVDLILTNPPFGAKFPVSMIQAKSQSSTPFFAKTAFTQRTIDSELLFIDRYLTLLRPGGYCLAVMPDGVVSAKGTAAIVRQHLTRSARIVAITELPPVTFAQAGTRTKTAVLMFQKRAEDVVRRAPIFFGEATDIGFEVSKRKGVPIKRQAGTNQLPEILNSFRTKKPRKADCETNLVAVWQHVDPMRLEAWTPRQFASNSKQVADSVGGRISIPRMLKDLVETPNRRRPQAYRDGFSYISVLHVIGEGLLDIASVKSYRPITPGLPVTPGEVIISRINPHIPRVLVVPNLGCPLLCSSEFEILKPKDGVSPYGLAYLLMSPIVQNQILALTAGTSASHSRVKPERLYDIQLPWPTDDGHLDFTRAVSEYQRASESLIASMVAISKLRREALSSSFCGIADLRMKNQ